LAPISWVFGFLLKIIGEFVKLEILAFVKYYLPGYKSGGPIRTIANMVDRLGDEFNFRIVTSDRDALDEKSYPHIAINEWNRVGKALVYYASPGKRSLLNWVKVIRGTHHSILYLNSFFDPVYTFRPLLARRFGLIPNRPVIIAPRGELSLGALELKRLKKAPYMALGMVSGLYKNLTWQASSKHEANDISRTMRYISKRIVIASNLPTINDFKLEFDPLGRREGPLQIVFLSRISPMKNLEFALNVVSKVRYPIIFNIYGPVRDDNYWRKCKSLIANMPENVSISYKGSVENSEVSSIIGSHDLFFLPTLGENFGHVILEALSAGTPVLIADTTPWRNLEEFGVGWSLPLCKEESYVDCINYAASQNSEYYKTWRKRVRAYAIEHFNDPGNAENNRKLFVDASLL